jgi:membrane protein required for colicin V production
MLIDIIFVILMVLAAIRGYRRGLIVGLFSFVAIIIGLAAAMKLSIVVAGYIGNAVNVSDRWLPIISFAVVFIAIVLLIMLGANIIQKTVEAGALGWVNRIGGILLYAVIYTMVFSVILFYAAMVKFIKPETIQESVTYSFIQPWGPKAIDAFGWLIPWFRDMFEDLQKFFDGVSKDIPPAKA